MHAVPSELWACCPPHPSDLGMLLHHSTLKDNVLAPWVVGCLLVQVRRDMRTTSARRFLVLAMRLCLRYGIDPKDARRRVLGVLESMGPLERTGSASVLREFARHLQVS